MQRLGEAKQSYGKEKHRIEWLRKSKESRRAATIGVAMDWPGIDGQRKSINM